MSALASKGDAHFNGDGLTENDSQHKHNATVTENLESPRRFFTIHIGPRKTGSSTIQRDMAANPFGPNTFGEKKDNAIYVGKREGGTWKDPNRMKTIRNVADKKGNPKFIRGSEEQVGFRYKVKCCIRILNTARKRSNNHTVFYHLLETDEAVRTSLREQFICDCWKGENSKDD